MTQKKTAWDKAFEKAPEDDRWLLQQLKTMPERGFPLAVLPKRLLEERDKEHEDA